MKRHTHTILIDYAALLEKAAILDELIDQAATYCAMKASDVDFVLYDQDFSGLIPLMADRMAFQVWLSVPVGSGPDARNWSWAEAEARLRNGECWDLLIGGGE